MSWGGQVLDTVAAEFPDVGDGAPRDRRA